MIGRIISKVLRIVIIAPVMALILFTLLYITHPEYFGSGLSYIFAIVFIVIFPVLAYPLQPLIPGFKGKGREGQRNLAMLMSAIGYCLGIISAFVIDVTFEILIIYMTYFFSGIIIFILNKVLKIRASGHACGVAGPIFVLIYFLGVEALFGLILIAAVYWSSLNMKRHSISELLIGSAIPAFALLISCGMALIIH